MLTSSVSLPTYALVFAQNRPGAPRASAFGFADKGMCGGKWTPEEDENLKLGVAALGPKKWLQISEEYLHHSRSAVQCLHRWQKVCLRHVCLLHVCVYVYVCVCVCVCVFVCVFVCVILCASVCYCV